MRDYRILNEVVIKVTDTNTNETREYAGLYNQVLDNFITTLNNPNSSYVSCKVGNGTAPTTPEMTQLSARIAVSSPDVISIASPTSVTVDQTTEVQKFLFTASFVYAVNAFTGPLTEIGFTFGLGQGNSNTIQSRVLLQDLGIVSLVIKSTDLVSVDYKFNVLLSFRSQVINAVLNDNGVNKNVKITYVPLIKLNSPTWSTFKDFLLTGTGNNIYNQIVNATSNRMGLNSASNTSTSIATAGNSDLGLRITINATDGNWSEGVAMYKFNTGDYLTFDPPILKDADTVVVLDLQSFRNRPSLSRQTEMLSVTDPLIPLIDLALNPTTLRFEDSTGTLTEFAPSKYMTGIVQGRAAAYTTVKLGHGINLSCKKKILLASPFKYSFKFIFWYVGSTQVSCLLDYNDSNIPYSSGNPRGVVLSYGYLELNIGVVSGSAPRFLLPNIANQWTDLTVHVNGSSLKVYANGTAIYTSDAFYPSSDMFGNLGFLNLLAPYAPNSDAFGPGDLFLNRFSFYDNHLISPGGVPTTTEIGSTVRTMALLNFQSGLPANTSTFKFLTAGGITWVADGGPNNLPYIRVVNGVMDVLSPAINFGPTENFTLEFDFYSETGSYLPGGITFDSDRKEISQATRAQLFLTSNSFHVFDWAATATRVGSVPQTALNAWSNWTIVRRNESGVNKLYVFKDGVLVQTVTYPTDSTLISMVGLGRMFIGHIGEKTVSLPSCTYRLANLRLTRGVIEYFNVAGFTPPVGLKTELF